MKHTLSIASICLIFAGVFSGTGSTLAADDGLTATSNAAGPSPLNCVPTSTGHVACGYVQVGICSGAGAGFATWLVDWELIVETDSGSDSASLNGSPAAALAGTPPCRTGDCTQVTLLADGTTVAESIKLCM